MVWCKCYYGVFFFVLENVLMLVIGCCLLEVYIEILVVGIICFFVDFMLWIVNLLCMDFCISCYFIYFIK